MLTLKSKIIYRDIIITACRQISSDLTISNKFEFIENIKDSAKANINNPDFPSNSQLFS